MPAARSTRAKNILALVVLLAAGAAQAATITVNSAADSVANDGVCTLREAIIASNGNQASGAAAGECVAGGSGGRDRIVFAIPGGGPATILPLSVLPTITGSLEIDGYTQPGASANTIVSLDGYDGVPGVTIDGSQSGPGTKPGLQLGDGSSGSLIRGLRITGFTSDACCADTGIVLGGNALSQIEIVGNIVHGNGSRGIFVGTNSSSTGIRIGGASAADRNLVYHHPNSTGIQVDRCINCVVRNNWVGLRRGVGTQPAPQANSVGIQLGSAMDGTEVVGNWVAGNLTGIVLGGASRFATVAANRVGAGFPNGRGVWILNIGTSLFPQDNTVQDNLITGNSQQGVIISNGVAGSQVIRNRLVGNRIFANGGLEIDLGANGGSFDGVTPNDPGDVDAGPNGLQNFPLLQAPAFDAGMVSIPYAIDSPAATYAIEVTFSSDCDASGHGPAGQVLSAPVRLTGRPASGTLTFQMPPAPTVGFITATADGTEGTSEYSLCMPYSDPHGETLFDSGFEP